MSAASQTWNQEYAEFLREHLQACSQVYDASCDIPEFIYQAPVSSVPEPYSFVLFFLGIVAMSVWFSIRRKTVS